jgi:hypothetical protein
LSKSRNLILTKPSLLVACLLLASCGGVSSGSSDNTDTDLDTIADRNDNCINIANTHQANIDADSFGDVCDNDRDGDGIYNINDDFPDNASQYLDLDGDGLGHTEDDDNDGDGFNDAVDNCPYVANSKSDGNGGFYQPDENGINDGAGLGDACELSGLNDTGQDSSGAFGFGNYSECSGSELGELQDCNHGRDYLARENVLTGDLAKVGAGDSGFDFTKLDSSGVALVDQVTPNITFYCVKDNLTGLTWEGKKSGDASTFNHKNDLFYWFDERDDWNAGVAGTKDAGTTGSERYAETGRHCAGFVEADESTWCNTQAFVKRMNALNEGQGYCGFNDWRLPNIKELNSIVDFGEPESPNVVSGNQLAIDETYFQWTQGRHYWTSTNDARLPAEAWTINFSFGASYVEAKSTAWLVRLVRDDVDQTSTTQEGAENE